MPSRNMTVWWFCFQGLMKDPSILHSTMTLKHFPILAFQGIGQAKGRVPWKQFPFPTLYETLKKEKEVLGIYYLPRYLLFTMKWGRTAISAGEQNGLPPFQPNQFLRWYLCVVTWKWRTMQRSHNAVTLSTCMRKGRPLECKTLFLGHCYLWPWSPTPISKDQITYRLK